MTQITSQAREALESSGVALVETSGGTRKSLYWTPDGREVWATPAMRTFIRKVGDKVVGGGVRDANFDKGWLPQPPTELKPYCSHCDKWHDTQEEIDACGEKKKAFQVRYDKIAKKARKEEGGDIEGLKAEVSEIKSEMSDIKDMLTQLLGKKE